MDTNTLKIKDFYNYNRKIVYVKESESLEKAVTLMMVNNFSQLPVVDNKHKDNDMILENHIKGYINWKITATTLFLEPDEKLISEIYKKDFTKVTYDSKLIDVTDSIFEKDFVFVINDKKRLSLVLTKESIGKLYYQKSIPFILIEQIERDLREILSNIELKEALNNSKFTQNYATLNELSFGEYVRIFENEKNWVNLPLKVDRKAFIKALDEIRMVRNKIMHFKSVEAEIEQESKFFGINEQEYKKIKSVGLFFRDLLKIL